MIRPILRRSGPDAKIIPIRAFIVILIGAFKADLFRTNFWGGKGMSETGLFEQVHATMLEAVVGPWGSIFVSFGLIVSVLGAYLAWSLICIKELAPSRAMPCQCSQPDAACV